MKALILSALLSSLSIPLFAMGSRAPASEEPVTVVTIIKANGKTLRIKSNDSTYMERAPDISGVTYSSSPRLCATSFKSSRSNLKAMETTLELTLLAQQLSIQTDRVLTENQIRRLSQVPDCAEYRPLLHAVATVLNNDGSRYQGFQVVEAN